MSKQQYYVTAEMLKKAGACRSDLNEFVDEFGTGEVLLNEANVVRAKKANLNLQWFASRIFWKVPYKHRLERPANRLAHEIGRLKRPAAIVKRLEKATEMWAQYKAEKSA